MQKLRGFIVWGPMKKPSKQQNALQLRGQSPGHENPETAACLVLLGRIADGKDDFARGAGLYKQALAIDEKALGKNSLEEADALDGQARNFTATAKFVEAEEAGKHALHIREEKLQPNDILIAKSLETLADLYKEKSDYADAASVANRALEITQKTYGPDDLPYADAESTLGKPCHRAGKLCARGRTAYTCFQNQEGSWRRKQPAVCGIAG